MRHRNERKRRPVLDGLEGRLAPSSLSPGGPPQDVRHDGDGGQDRDRDRNGDRDRDRDRDGGRQDNGSWEPKPIGHGSTRPQVPSGPVRW
jgi:hypothetical protein